MSDSMWKKEISFKRKPKADAEASVAPESAFVAPEPPKQSFLKKEISFSRKKKHSQEIERLVHEATQSLVPTVPLAESASAETLPTALAEAAVAAMAQAHAEEQAAEQRAQAEALAQAEAPAQVEVHAAADLGGVPPVFDAHAVAVPGFVEHPPVESEPAPPQPAVPLTLAPGLPPEPPAPLSEHASPLPEPPSLYVQSSPHEVAPVPGISPVLDAGPVPVLPVDDRPRDLSSLSPAILALSAEVPAAEQPVAPEPVATEPYVVEPVPVEPAAWPETHAGVAVFPPVAAADLPPLPDAGSSAPFWKKELSFSRKAKAPKAPKTPKAERAPKVKSSSTPFWKKELSLGRKTQAPVDVPVADAPTTVLPAAPKPPRQKRTLSLPTLSLPMRPSKGKNGKHAVKKLVGLKVGSSQLAAARVSNNGVAEVHQLAREALAPGIVVGGELRDPEALGDALKGFFARNKLPRKGVRLGIASNRIGVRIFDIVGVTEEKQLANAIHFRAQEALPIPLDEAVLDFRVLDESTDAEGQNVKRVLLVVVYRELVERYVSACKKAGITLAGIDLEAFALLRTLGAPVDRGSSALVGVAIGYDRSMFAVSDGRVCEFTRVLEWGGAALNVALARTFDCAPSEVEAIKRNLSLDGSIVPAGLTEEQLAVALDAVRRQVQSFARELVSSLQFYQNQPGSLGIGEIVITGGTTHLPGLAAELERLIGVHVRVGDPFGRVKVSSRLAGVEQSGSLAVAIGLGIED